MPNQIMHPSLSQLLPLDKIPNEIEAVRDALASIFSDIYIKNLIASQSYDGSSGFYSFTLTTYNSIGIDIPIADDLKLVLNPTVQGTTEIPVSFDYSWIILKYIRDFNFESFDNTVQSVLRILFDLAEIDERQLLNEVIYAFYPGPTGLEDFVQDFNGNYNQSLIVSDDDDLTFEEKTDEISDIIGGVDYDVVQVVYDSVIEVNGEGLQRLKLLFARLFDNVEQNLKEALELNFNAIIQEISVGLQFPHKWLQPVYTGNEPVSGLNQDDPLPDNYFSYLKFDVGSLEYSSKRGFEFNNISAFTLNRSIIGNTGLIAEFSGLKIDLYKDRNIPEADADGRDVSFKGVYADNIAITLPRKWFKKEDGQTLQISGKQLLVGTGGISGTLVLETENNTPTEADDFFWFKLGGDNGFRIGFNQFDISFKQNKVVSSGISAALEIPKLKNSSGNQLQIPIVGHLNDDGDFNLTASFNNALQASLGEYVDFNFLSLEVGKQDDDFYIGTSVEITFPSGIMAEITGGQKLVIPKIRFYSNGRFEIVGGNGFLPVNFNLPLGPVDISVTGIHLGSIQKEHNGVMRSYNYIGFDGAISVEPFALDARGEGIKYYYTTDNDAHGGHGDHFLHIQTIEIDLVVPASTKAVSLHGMLSIPEPGASQEYMGEIEFKLKKGGISGKAAMKLAPKFPAFIVDAEVTLPKPIPLGSFAIYGFRGLVGFRYVAEKKAIKSLPPNATWYEYYKYPPKGIHVSKFTGPYDSSGYSNPFSFGAGAVLGTSFDNGTVISLRAMVLLSIPSLFMIEARASLISARLGLTDSKEPPFWAMVAWGDNAIESGMGADFKMPTATGKVVTLQANVESFFPLTSSAGAWYINIGTKQKPNTATLFKDVINLRAMTYLMIASQGIEFGARLDYEVKKSFAGIKVKLWAFIEVGARISFERPQFGGYLHFGGGIEVNVWRAIYISAVLNAYLSGEAVKPYLIFAELQFRGRIRIAKFIKISFRIKLQLKWEKSREVDTRPIPALANGTNVLENKTGELVKGVHMLTNEIFDLVYTTNVPQINQINKVIPLDTFVDIKFTKGVVPNGNNISSKIGGHTSGATNFIDLVPPDKTVKGGRVLRQVKHKYSIEGISIKAWDGSGWVDYHPTQALFDVNDTQYPIAGQQKLGFWQRSGNQYDTIRVLGTNPFSYVDAGEPGWFIPEQYGITASNLFCHTQSDIWHTSNVLNRNLGATYPSTGGFNSYFINGAYFSTLGEYGAFPLLATAVPYNAMRVTNTPNNHNFAKSLTFNNVNGLQILLPDDSPYVKLKLTSYSENVTINFYKTIIISNSSSVGYELVDTVTKTQIELEDDVIFEDANNPIVKIEVLPITPQFDQINLIQEQIEALFTDTYESSDGVVNVTMPSDMVLYNSLVNQLEILLVTGCSLSTQGCSDRDALLCDLYDDLIALGCFEVMASSSSEFLMSCYDVFIQTIKDTMATSQYITDHVGSYYQDCWDYWNALSNMVDAGNYSESELMQAYVKLYNSAITLLNYLETIGNCKCNTSVCTTSFQEIKWKTMSEYEYEATIPGIAEIQADQAAMVAATTNTVQPIWRPNTYFYINFKLKDTVNEGANSEVFDYYYSFKTAGPIGHFHDANGVHYGTEYDKGNPSLVLNRKNLAEQFTSNGKLTNPDKYALTSLRSYIDYKRSYPNADGNLLQSKPIFWGNDACKIKLFFTKPLAYHMFKSWSDYNGLGTINGALNIMIKDPVSEVVIPYPLPVSSTEIPLTNPTGETEWIADNDPRLPMSIQILNNLIEHGQIPCELQIGEPLVPLSYTYSVSVTNLKPQKLYTALVNNAFDSNGDGLFNDYIDATRNVAINDNKTVHQFVFQTSRYKDFDSQVRSYELSDGNNTRKAIFELSKELTPESVSNAYAIVSNSNIDIDPSVSSYLDLFDRVLEGVFKFKPLEPAMTTEFNVITDSVSSKKVALLVRNPEPFNNPRTPIDIIQDTIQIVDDNEIPRQGFKVLFSKDYSQMIIMHEGLELLDSVLHIKFTYKEWNGNAYQVEGDPVFVSIEI